jgi:hypothetical protein
VVFDTLVDLIERLGLVVNWKKVALPTQQIVFLCVGVSRKLTLPETKLKELIDLVELWTHKRRTTKKELQRFLGKLNWACRVVRGGRTFVRRLIDLLTRMSESHHHARINVAAKNDISWWSEGLKLFHGNCSFVCDQVLPAHCFSTDACLSGGGAHFLSDWIYCNWELDFPSYSKCHINVLELLMVLVSIKRWGELWSGTHVLVRTDNVTAMSALNKGTSRCKDLMPIVREFFWLSIKNDFVISSVFVPGVLNVLADRVSRLDDPLLAKEAGELLDVNFIEGNCVNHMSNDSFNYLQGQWMLDSSGY